MSDQVGNKIQSSGQIGNKGASTSAQIGNKASGPVRGYVSSVMDAAMNKAQGKGREIQKKAAAHF